MRSTMQHTVFYTDRHFCCIHIELVELNFLFCCSVLPDFQNNLCSIFFQPSSFLVLFTGHVIAAFIKLRFG